LASERVQRRLTAILAADVAGYSRLMGVDEEGTLAQLKAHLRALVDPKITEHEGRIVKTTGDGMLVEFASVVDAVRCAIEVQRAMVERNAEVPQVKRIEFRVGINVGDIIIEGGDIFGDGVNVAARLEGLAQPGGVCLSDAAYQHVVSRLETSFTEMGERQLRNIARPVRVWHWTVTAPSAGSVDHDQPFTLPDKPSIAVLPFVNMSGDAKQEYFSDGITEDIITDLSKIPDLFVIARNSTFVYKGKATDVRTIGRELGVAYLLEGSVRSSGQRVRITAQLINAGNGNHLWAERFDRDLTDVFVIQDEVRERIVAALSLQLHRGLQQPRSAVDPDAYDFFLRGRDAAYHRPDDSSGQARKMFERAIAIDSSYAAPYAGLGYLVMLDYANRRSDESERFLSKAEELAGKALKLDPQSPDAYLLMGVVHNWKREHDEAIACAQTAIRLDPNFARAHALLGQVLHYAGRNDEALIPLRQAMRLDPHCPDLYFHFLGQSYFMLGRYPQACAEFEKRILLNPSTDISRVMLAACYGHLGRVEDARNQWRQALEINPRYSFEHKRRVLPYRNKEDFERIAQDLRLAGLPEPTLCERAPNGR
jgi:adenylate cyclase